MEEFVGEGLAEQGKVREIRAVTGRETDKVCFLWTDEGVAEKMLKDCWRDGVQGRGKQGQRRRKENSEGSREKNRNKLT